ncbi:MAG: hypothetical protein J6Y20_15035 [Lachnospiraceae bacterium]|nr:hypothetical protein [Lachnospiraceae bacterium]
MTHEDAMEMRAEYYENPNPSADEEFRFTEALGMLIETTKDPRYMTELAWFYCSRKKFDTEQRYLEMAAECGYGPAYEELGYMYYYGQNGEKDYAGAFECFTRGAQPDRYGNKGSLWCTYKLADMYRFGCHVAKDEERYREMIEAAYEKVKNPKFMNDPFPEIAYRLAGIRAEQGKTEEAVELLNSAKRFMAERLSWDPFWGHIEVMGRIVRLLYRLTPYNADKTDFYDLFYLTQSCGRYSVRRKGRQLILEVTGEGAEQALRYDGRWYRNFEDFCAKAKVDGQSITSIYDEFYDLKAG